MTLEIVDLFCGAGGTSTGILKAVQERLKRKARLTAVNHWPTAINTHSLNHPDVHHLCENVENIHPRNVVRSGRIHLLAASCECTFHSNARGGGPCNEQSRSQPWQLIRWATDINVENILMENVREFKNWGPLHRRTKRPIKSRKGEYFKAFVNALHNLYDSVEFKVQVAADFGDPTSRERLMLIARKGSPVVWPKPTHGPGRALPYRTARECIDWDLKGKSIFGRKRPLCQNTLRRIAAGLKKFGGVSAEPFLIMLNGTSDSHIQSSVRSLNDPLPTVVANGNHFALCEPFIASYHGGHNNIRTHSVDAPLPTQDTSNRFALVEPFIYQITHGGSGDRCRSIDSPLPTITTSKRGEFALCEPLILKYYKTGCCKPVWRLDIRVRMLQPGELAAAHSFPDSYQFTGNKEDQTKQIGNSVPVELAAAHAEAALS